MLRDGKYAFRLLSKSPAFALTAIAVLALGIGANVAIFSIIDAVLLKPFSWPDSGRLVLFLMSSPHGPTYGASATKFNLWRQQTNAFEDVAAYEYNGSHTTLGSPPGDVVHTIRVSQAYFRLLGVRMLKGRAFTSQEDQPGGGNPAVLTYGLWQWHFAADPDICGRSITLGGSPHVVIGIVDAQFETGLDSPPDIFLPFQIDPQTHDNAQYFNVIGRLRAGVPLQQANVLLGMASEQFRRSYPQILGPQERFSVIPFVDSLVGDARPALLILAAAVGFVLLIACANIANLLLIRAAARKREMAIRVAIGATRADLVRQLLVESFLLALVGGGIGLGGGLVGVRVLLAFNPTDLPRMGEHGSALGLDWRVAAFAIAVSLLTAILFGLLPALNASRMEFKPRHARTRSILVVSELALATMLLVGAALLLRTFIALRALDPGFNPHNVLTVRTSPGRADPNAVERLQAVPGVARAAATYTLPLEGAFGIPFQIVDRSRGNGEYEGRGWIAASPGYFDVFRIPLKLGRRFSDRDTAGASPVAIVNQAMLRKFWPHANPLGGRILLGHRYGPEFEEPAREIVGVVGDVHDFGLNRDPAPMVYVPLAQVPPGITTLLNRVASLTWIVRTHVPPLSVAPAIQRELEGRFLQIRSMDAVSDQTMAGERFRMTVLSIFAMTALLLAIIGLYGLLGYSVQQRTKEIGIRIAIGAQPRQVQRMVVFEGMRLAVSGVVVGGALALLLSRILAAFLFGVTASDAASFLTVALILMLASLGAVWIPARRASRVDASAALKQS